MKIFRLMIVAALATVAVSCIKNEPLNAECDITAVFLADESAFDRTPEIGNNEVILLVKSKADVTNLALEFELTPGATIEPASGTPRDFTTPQTYTTTSQDGKWHKTYTVFVRRNNTANLNFNFETAREYSNLGYKYDVFYETNSAGDEILTWASGNPGYALTGMGTNPESFPTFQSDEGYIGKCVQMVTRRTGAFGEMAKKPLAAGNIFIGRFVTATAMSRPLESTQFGMAFNNIPITLSGYYNYTPGETYYERNNAGKLDAVPGKVDECNIYSVFFEVTEDREWLDGTNVMAEDNPNIIAIARLNPEDRTATNGWKQFSVPYVFRKGKVVDPQKLIEGKYSITVVCSSSIDGDFFSGAIGSTLLVDDVYVTCLNGDED